MLLVPSDVDEPPILETRQGIKEFKESFKNEKESIIKVGSGELVTVSIPRFTINHFCSLIV